MFLNVSTFAILNSLYFTNNHEKPPKISSNYDRLSKIRKLFEIQKEIFKSVYERTKELALNEVMIKIKGHVPFSHYIWKIMGY